jgi:integrase
VNLCDAEEFLTNLKAEAYKALRYGISADHLWQEAVVRYLQENAEKLSLDKDKIYLKQLDPYLSGKRLEEINMDCLWPFIHSRKEEHGSANTTVNRHLEVVRRILHLARDEWCWIQRFPRIRMLKEPRKRIRFLTRIEANRLLEALPEHLRPVMQFALASGCRRNEILQMEWRRVDFNRRVAWLDHGTTKNTEGRGLPLNRDAILALRSVQGQDRRWCFTYKGKTMKQIGSAWKRALVKADIENFRFHDLRHTWASWHVMSGTSLQELMELGGWKSYEMVLRYAHLAPEQLASAAARIEQRIEPVVENATFSLR